MIATHTANRVAPVAQTSKSAVSRVSKPAGGTTFHSLPTWKSAIQQVWKPALLLGVVALALTGCATVQPWQRKTLSDYTMRGERDPIGDAQAEHIFFSREMSSGGRGVGGGGCGCN